MKNRHITWKRVHLIFFCCLISMPSVWGIDTDVSQQIKAHQAWVETHIPLPDTLNQEQLFIEATKAIVTPCVEERYINIIKYAGEQQALTCLTEYAEAKKQRIIDKDNALERQCLQQLLEKSKILNGPSSYATTQIYMYLFLTSAEFEEQTEWIQKFYTSAKALYAASSTPQNEEIWLFAQFLNTAGSTLQGYENPLDFEQCRLISTDIIKFYMRTHIISEIRAYAYDCIAAYFSYCNKYSEFHAYINKKLYDKNDSILNGKFPMSYLTEDTNHEECLDYQDLLKAAIDILIRCLHIYHPDVINLKIKYCSSVFPDETTEENAIQLQNYTQSYYGAHSIESAIANQSLRAMYVWQHKNQTFNYTQLIDVLDAYYSTSSNRYLNMLEDEMLIQIMGGNTEHVLIIANTINSIANKKYQNNKIRKLSLSDTNWYLQRQGVSGYETAFDDMVQEFVDNCEQQIDFKTIGLCIDLRDHAWTKFGDIVTTLNLQRKVLSLLDKLVGQEHPIFVFEYLQYGNMTTSSYPADAITLDGENDAESLYTDIIKKAKTCNATAMALTTAGQYYLQQSEFTKARMLFVQAVSEIEGAEKAMPKTPEEEKTNRYYLASLYAYIMKSYYGEHITTDSIDYYGGKLLQEFENGIDFQPRYNFHIHEAVVSYYLRKNQIKEGEQLLTQYLEYYDRNPNETIDGFYIQIIQALVQIYGNAYGDLDKCLLLAERIARDIDKIKDLGNFDTYIGLLRILYDLVEYKNPYDMVLLAKYRTLLEAAIGKYVLASKNNESVVFNYGLYLVTKTIGFAAREPMYRAVAIANSSEEEYERNSWQPLKKNIIENQIPLLLQMKERMEQAYPTNYKLSPNYHQILLDLAIATQRCAADIEMAEQYYILLSQCNEQIGLSYLGNFYMETGNKDKAAATYAHFEQILEAQDVNNAKDMFMNIRGDSYGRIGIAYYQAGEYDKAIKAAHIFYESIQAQIEKNFDFYTQNEREAFIMKNGSGGTLLEWLLPHRPEELSSDVYNVILREKGLLLRASERIQASILSSNNDTLIHAVDSLRSIQQQLQIMANNNSESQEDFRILRDKHDQLERYVVRASEPYRKKEDDIPNWEQVKNCLNEGEACIEYVVTDSAVVALVLTPNANTPQCVTLMNRKEMEEIFEKITNSPKERLIKDFYERNTVHLYNKLWQPLEQYLEDAQTVFYSPTSFLNAIAFAAIPLPDKKFLIDKYDLHQLTTTGILVNRKSGSANASPKSANIYGSIFYTDKQKDVNEPYIAEIRKNNSFTDKMLFAQNKKREAIEDEYPFLLFTLDECDKITLTLTENQISVNEKIGDNPTEKEIRSLSGQSPEILHISTHGFFYNNFGKAKQIPYFQRFNQLNTMLCSGLVLANGEYTWQGENQNAEPSEDNILSSSEIASLDFGNTKLVVLSACETGLGSFETDGVFGLQRGFKQAGVKAICASLWSVNDLSTSQLMQSFYNLWITKYKGADMQKAMKEAMLEQRKKTPAPYNWAPFVMYDADI